MWPESIYFTLTDPERSELVDQLAGRSSTPIYDRLKAEHDRRNKIAEAKSEFLKVAVQYEVHPFDIESEDFHKMTSSLSRLMLESFSEAQGFVYDTYGKGADTFNGGMTYALRIMQAIFDGVLQED